ncbi:putative phosphoesterase [Weissella uvarum]|uniref:YfcE family phosphodiesterase n=1 Tax=Weissella uvarum TaxID=1479233 RepID=UPI0019609985|nr:YfcE family phosphodiesterase [Weissella uvarum]MBM7617583.1 putative phosphoesterase [Weissella uvarum]MCM0595535.1 YfcE family phosphodiesterase [Weissella uvarum]
MDYLIASDAHGDQKILAQLANDYRDRVKAMFYVGDSELRHDDDVFNDFLPVIGNMDMDSLFPDDREYQDVDVKIYIAHGHLYHTEMDLSRLIEAAAHKDVDVVLTGHTHQLGAEMIDGILYLNPGSISVPRGQFAYLKGTYAILSVEPDKFEVQFYTRDEQPVSGLQFEFKRPQ